MPHIIVIAGTTESERVITLVEERWPHALGYRPRWVGTDGVNIALARMVAPDPSLATRYLGTTQRIDFDAPLAKAWLSKLAGAHPELLRQDPRPIGALTAYDAVYAMAYSIAAVGQRPMTGADVAAGLRSLNRRGAPGTPTATSSRTSTFCG